MKTVHIGGVPVTSPAVMAPIAGMTDQPYRRIVMAQGAGFTVSELISANALVRNNKKTWDMLPAKNEQKPVAVQIFGAEPEVMRDAAVMVDESGSCDIIDINFGCPVKKVTACGAGAAALKDSSIIERIVTSVVKAVKKPVTIKIRIGWDSDSINATYVAKIAEAAGVAAVSVHGRTASQGYKGKADWSVISDVVQAVKIPVIGNGDILTPEEAFSRLKTSGCALVMIGRAALGAPWIFTQINELAESGTYRAPSLQEREKIVLSHLAMMSERYGDKIGIKKMRTHIAYYTRGMIDSARFRDEINHTSGVVEVSRLISDFFAKANGQKTNGALASVNV